MSSSTASRPERGDPPRTGRVLGVLVAVWTTAAILVLTVAAETEVGPIVLKLSQRHGIHLGDLVALALFGVLALVITARVLWGSRR